MTEAELRAIESRLDFIKPAMRDTLQRLITEVRLLKSELRDRAEHESGCPKRYTQPQLSAGLKTEGECFCGLDELAEIAFVSQEVA